MQVHKYFEALKEEDRPLKGTDGEKKREEAFERQVRAQINIAGLVLLEWRIVLP